MANESVSLGIPKPKNEKILTWWYKFRVFLQDYPHFPHLGKNNISKLIWVFPKIVVPPNHPFVHRVFHDKSSILGGPPLFLETPICTNRPNRPSQPFPRFATPNLHGFVGCEATKFHLERHRTAPFTSRGPQQNPFRNQGVNPP